MRYWVELADSVSERLAGQPVDVVTGIEHHLELLSADPTGLSRPAAFPYAPVGQMCQFWIMRDDGRGGHYVTILFQYGADEQTLHVYGLSIQDVGPEYFM